MTGRVIAKALFGSRIPRFVIGLIVVVAVVESAYLGVKYLQTPWTRAHDGHPPLVGYWQGEMEFEPGDTRQVALYVREFETAGEFLLRSSMADWDGTPDPDIRVMAKLCGPNGGARYHGEGDVANREGTRFTFDLGPDGPAPGKHPTDLEGVWDGGDRLELTSRLYTESRDGVAGATASVAARPVVSDHTEIIRFEMRRITEEAFAKAC